MEAIAFASLAAVACIRAESMGNDSEPHGAAAKDTVGSTGVQQGFMGLLLSLLSLVTVLMNLLVLYAVRTEKSLRTVGNMYIVSLAAADLIIGALVMPFSIVYILMAEWRLGREACKLWLSLDYVASTASIYSLFMLCLDRYRSVKHPLQYIRFRTKARAAGLIAAAWILSCAWVIPIFGWRRIVHGGRKTVPENQCDTEFRHVTWFKVLACIFNFYLPSALILWYYTKIYLAVQRRYQQWTCSKGSPFRGESVPKRQAPFRCFTNGSRWRKKMVPRRSSRNKACRRLHLNWGSASRKTVIRVGQLPGRNQARKKAQGTSSRGGLSCNTSPKSYRDGGSLCGCKTTKEVGWDSEIPGLEEDNNRHSPERDSSHFLDVENMLVSDCRPELDGDPRQYRGAGRSALVEQQVSHLMAVEHRKETKVLHGGCESLSRNNRYGALGLNDLMDTAEIRRGGGADPAAFQGCFSGIFQPNIPLQCRATTAERYYFKELMERRGDADCGNQETYDSPDGLGTRTVPFAFRRFNFSDHQKKEASPAGNYRGRGLLRPPWQYLFSQTSLSMPKFWLNKEQKAAKQLGAIMVVFLACWIPYFLTFMVMAACEHCVPQDLHMFTIWLGYLNSTLNPFIYPFCNVTFKKTLKSILRIQSSRGKLIVGLPACTVA
nr:PREDICTED: muscarinic acetylcholine receptor M3-like [Latimeria chalumnae]|eukprot:XP_014350162.1 PREDICTED: muscarinic acetylcholine receptor M3-like [Latimeria chalumnae]